MSYVSTKKPVAEVYMVETIAGASPRLVRLGRAFSRDGGTALIIELDAEVTLGPDTPLSIIRA